MLRFNDKTDKKIKIKNYTRKKRNQKKEERKKAIKATREGEQVQVQVDIKYIPLECIGFKSEVDRYYQITGIDVYTRKRILKIVKEKSTY